MRAVLMEILRALRVEALLVVVLGAMLAGASGALLVGASRVLLVGALGGIEVCVPSKFLDEVGAPAPLAGVSKLCPANETAERR